MKYIVEVDGQRLEVQLDGTGVHVDGHAVRAHLENIEGTPVHLVRLGEEVHRVAVRPGDSRGRYVLWFNGRRFDVEALDERTRAIRELTRAGERRAGPAPLVAPMPGLIVRVDVREGDVVRPGQGLVVMEAMKMENELRTTSGGTVQAVLVQPGAAVEKGTVLIQLA